MTYGKFLRIMWEMRQKWLSSELRWHLVTKHTIYKVTVRKGFRRKVYRNTGDSWVDALELAKWEEQNPS